MLAGVDEDVHRRRWLMLAVLCLAMLLIIVNSSSLNVALPTMARDLDATSAPLLGTERLIRSDVFHGQPCPSDPPSYQYSSLFPRFGWDYYICHTFDSPW